MPKTKSTTQYEVHLQSGFTKNLLIGTIPTTISEQDIDELSSMEAAIHVLAIHLEAPKDWVRQHVKGYRVGLFGMYLLGFRGKTYVVEVWERVKSPVKV